MHHVSPQQVALAWELSQAPVVIPIPGASRPESIQDSVLAADLLLGPEELAAARRELTSAERILERRERVGREEHEPHQLDAGRRLPHGLDGDPRHVLDRPPVHARR